MLKQRRTTTGTMSYNAAVFLLYLSLFQEGLLFKVIRPDQK